MAGWLRRMLTGTGGQEDGLDDLPPELRDAYQAAQGALPPGWGLGFPDRERYGSGAQRADVWSVAATGPDRQVAAGAALDEAGAYTALADRLQGELDPSDGGWAPPVGDNHLAGDLYTPGSPGPAAGMSVEDLVRAEVEGLLPAGWALDRPDRELYPTGLETWGLVVRGPDDRYLLVVASGQQVDAYRQLVRLLRGELTVRDRWAPF